MVEPTAARDVAWSFLKGYLALAYGRGRGSVVDATPLLRHELARQAALVTPTEHDRHARVVSLEVVRSGHDVARAGAFVSDGGITSYRLRLTLQRGRFGWQVSGLSGG